MKIGVIILARANFGRWPDKVLYMLQGKTLLEHVIRKSKLLNVDTVIVSTTLQDEDSIIRKIARNNNAEYSYGNPNDRTERYFQAVEEFNLDFYMSISPAVPFFDVEYTNRLIAAARDNPTYEFYRLGGHTRSHVPWISSGPLLYERLKQPGRDQELYRDPRRNYQEFTLYNWEDPEVKNRYLFDGNIAYPIQADNHQRICACLGHFPNSYEEVIQALLTIL